MAIVLRSLDWTHSTGFGADDVCDWPEGVLQTLLEAGILRESGYAKSVTCNQCDERCSVAVEFDDEDSAGRAFYDCPLRDDIGRVRVEAERLRQWGVSRQGLAEALATELRTATTPEEITGERFWWLGPSDTGRHRFDVFLAVGADRQDSAAIFPEVKKITECSRAVVLVLCDSPSASPFGSSAIVLSLVRLLTLTEGALKLDSEEIAALVRKSRASRIQEVTPFPTPPGTEWDRVSIAFVDEETAIVSAGSLSKPLDFRQMGFLDKRTEASPDKLWQILLFMSMYDGRMEWGDRLSRQDILKRKKHVSDLRSRLQRFFCLPGDPFEPYSKVRGYKAKFAMGVVERRSR